MRDASRRPLYGAYSPAGFTHSLTRDSDARALQRGRQSRTQTRGDKDTHWHTQSCMRDASRRPLYGAYSPAGFTHSLTRDSDARALQRGRQSRTRSEEHASELQSQMRISYAVFCLKKKTIIYKKPTKS